MDGCNKTPDINKDNGCWKMRQVNKFRYIWVLLARVGNKVP